MRLHAVDTHRDIPQRVGACKSVRVENQEESSKSSSSQRRNAELQSDQQNYGDDPLADRATDLYRREFVMGFADKSRTQTFPRPPLPGTVLLRATS